MTSLSKNARVAGLLFILTTLVGCVRLLYIPGALIIHENASATANNIAAHELLFRLGTVSELLAGVMWIGVTLALYRLLKGVNQELAVLMVVLGSLMQVPIFFINSLTDAAALLFVRGADFLAVFDKPQRDALAICSSTFIITSTWPMRSFGVSGCFRLACWSTDRASCPASSASG